MIVNKNIKIILFIFLLCVFGILGYYSVITSNYRTAKQILINDINIEELKKSLDEEPKLNVELKINKDNTYYNDVEDAYFYCLDVNDANSYKNLNLKIHSKEKYKYVILNENYDKEKGFFIDFNIPVDLIIYNDEVYYQTQIKFRNVPIVNIITDHQFVREYQGMKLQFFGPNPNNKEKMLLTESYTQLKVRGGTSFVFPKQQYKISLTQEDMEKKSKISLFGMNADEDYILDAMWNDYSKIRTKLSFELWNQMSSHNVNYGQFDYDAEYVELYINQEYNGLYMLKEFIDWRMLGVNKFTEENSGIVLKGNGYAKWDQALYDQDKNTDFVLGFSMKYPSNKSDYSKYWDFMMDKIYTEFYDRDNVTEEYILENFDLENYIDYKIFIHIICGNDNFGLNNVYCYIKSMNEGNKIKLVPWDLDMTWGYDWSGEKPTLLYEESETIYKVDGLLTNSENINNALRKRYFELRDSVLSIDNVFNIIDTNYETLKYPIKSDSDKWLDTDLDIEVNKLKDWYKKRVEFLDEYLQ